jgi:hypothetical protein
MALSRSRFALSPLAETLGSMIVLGKPCSDPWLTSWHSRHRGVFSAALDADPFAKGLVTLLGSTKWLPHFVGIPPPGGQDSRPAQVRVETHVSPGWPRRRALLERDVTYRAGLLAAYGWPAPCNT